MYMYSVCFKMCVKVDMKLFYLILPPPCGCKPLHSFIHVHVQKCIIYIFVYYTYKVCILYLQSMDIDPTPLLSFLTLGAHAQRGLQYLVCHSVCLSVCYHVFCHYVQQGGQKAIPTGSVPHWLDFKNGDFRKSTAFKSYGVKTKRTSQYANEHGSDSAHFEHGGGSRSNTKGEYVVLVFQKHYLPT